jgi:hypothetical protein
MAIVVEINAHRPQRERPSAGPKTKAADAKFSYNAFTSALTGQTVLLPADEIDAYRTLVQSLIDRHRPASRDAHVLVQSLASIEWDLRHIPSREAEIYRVGRAALAHLHSDQDPEIRAALIQAETFLKYQREFRDLTLQETRLLRLRGKTLARLQQIAPAPSLRGKA